MAIWKLTPLDLFDPNRQARSHQGIAIVRARDEADARKTAAKAFDTKTRFRPVEAQKFPPWKRPQLVKVERIEDPRYRRLPLGPAGALVIALLTF